ncbi:hypothetical protein ABPG72_017270 [Tetrahymena utriculariae]
MLNIDNNNYIRKIYDKSVSLHEYKQKECEKHYQHEEQQEDVEALVEKQDIKENDDEIWDRLDYKCQNEAKQFNKSIYKDIKAQKASDVFIFEDNFDKNNKILSHNEKYIIYERKVDLLKAINKVMLYQEQNNLVDYHPNINSISGEIKQLVNQEMEKRPNQWYYPEQKNEKKQNTEDIVKVRNIIHQSLQPYHKDYTQSLKKNEIEEYFERVKQNKGGYDQWGKQYKASLSEFLWLPAVFAYSENNKMYEIQGKLFDPLKNYPDLGELKLELGHLMTYFSKPLQQTHNYFKKLGYKILNEFYDDGIKIYDEKSRVDFSQKIHAIVKISEIEIAPQSIYSGQWHVEGFSSDNILYTCLYVIEHDENLTNGKLKFKRTPRESDDPCNRMQEQCAHTYCPDYERFCDPHKLIPLGSLDIKENLMIIFPNQNIHKVKGIKNITNKPLKRKIIAFFVVNHEDQPFTINDVEFTKPIEFIKVYRMRDMYERSKNKQTEAQAFNQYMITKNLD